MKIVLRIALALMVLSLSFVDYNSVVSAQVLKMPTSKDKIAMSYVDVIGRTMPDELDKKNMDIAKSVTQSFFKALSDKQYRVAYNYYSPEIQNKIGYEAFVDSLSNVISINLQYCGPYSFAPNLIVMDGRYEQVNRTDDQKIDPRLYEFRFAVSKIGNEWKIADMIYEDVTLKNL